MRILNKTDDRITIDGNRIEAGEILEIDDEDYTGSLKTATETAWLAGDVGLFDLPEAIEIGSFTGTDGSSSGSKVEAVVFALNNSPAGNESSGLTDIGDPAVFVDLVFDIESDD